MKAAGTRRMLTRAEVAAMFGVIPRTVTRWEKDGKLAGLTVIETLGGHRRFYEDEVRALLAGQQR